MILSVHLPHSRCKISDHRDTLSEGKTFLEKRSKGPVFAWNRLQCQCSWSVGPRLDCRGSGGEVKKIPLHAREAETRTVCSVHGRAWLDGMQHLAKYRVFGVDVHAKCVERRTRSADRFHSGITRLVPPRHLVSTKTRTQPQTSQASTCEAVNKHVVCNLGTKYH